MNDKAAVYVELDGGFYAYGESCELNLNQDGTITITGIQIMNEYQGEVKHG
jgi:hypothetical protein